MFTGIIEEIGLVVLIEQPEHDARDARIVVRGPLVTQDVSLGDSISVNGVCLTVTKFGDGEFTADVMPETMRRTTLGLLSSGSEVNLERALAVGDRLGGHIVQGHVDTVTRLRSRTPGPRWDELVFDLPQDVAALIAEKGSITIDGVSLTVSTVTRDSFTVSLIPATLEHTTLGSRQVEDKVNIETDVVAKHVARLKEWDR